MQSNEYRSPAHPEPPRQHLASPWTLLGMTLAIGVTLVLIFPGSGLLTQSEPLTAQTVKERFTAASARQREANEREEARQQQQQPSTGDAAVTRPRAPAIVQLEERLVKEPNNSEVRFALAQKQKDFGDVSQARAALEPLYNSSDPAIRQRARLQDFDLQLQQMQALQPRSTERARETDRLRQELAAMSQYDWDAAGALELANLAQRLGARRLRAELLLRAVRSDQSVSRAAVEDAARSALADSQYATAAEIYFAAQERAVSRDDQRHYFTGAMNAYRRGNMLREGLSAADRHVGALINDDATLRLLIDIARLANDNARAQAYVKRLMRMSQRDPFTHVLQALLALVIPSAIAAEGTPAGQRGKPPAGMRPYDPENYRLAYEIFLASRNLADAYRVAASAVQQVPDDMVWRERLAQVAEWSDRPGEALEQWIFIARRTGRPAAWQAVLRLAPGLLDDEALLEAMRWQSTTRGEMTDEQWRALVAAYDRVGRQGEAVELLNREIARRPRPVLLELQAGVLERTGDIDGAIAANRRLIELGGADMTRVSNLATLLMARRDYKGAYDLLQGMRGHIAPDDAQYWRMLADLSWELQHERDAQRALNTLLRMDRATAWDFTRLVAILQKTQPEAAARLAETGYQKFGTPDFLLAALGIYSLRRDFASMGRLLGRLDAETEAELAKRPDFLMLRAEYRSATGHADLASADYRAALAIDPAHRVARIALTWFLIDRQRVAELRAEMPDVLRAGADDPAFDPVLGAAFLLLGDKRRGVEYFARVVKRNPDDYLWLLNYADALEQDNQSDMAWRVRRHAWMKVRQEAEKKPPTRTELELLQAQARLAIGSTGPGEQGAAIMRNLLRADGGADAGSGDPLRRALDAGTRDIIMAWTITTEQRLAARTWLIRQYGRNLAKPAWAEVNQALVENDVDTLQRALEQYADAIPRYDRHDAARRTQQYRLAQDIAFTELERRPHDDEMHLRLTNSTLDMASNIETGYTRYRRGSLGGHEWTGGLTMWSSPRLRLSFDVSVIHQGILDYGTFASVPAEDRLYTLTALMRHSHGETTLSVFHRDALSSNVGLRLTMQRPLGARLTGRIGLSYNERTLETAALQAGGMRDRASIDLSYVLSKREYVIGELYTSRYYTQERTFIGSSYGLNWEAGHRFRTEYPDLHVRLAGSFNHFSRNGAGDLETAVLVPGGAIPPSSFFLPESFSVVGVYTGFGLFYRTNYTRAVRPFADFGVLHNTVTGAGYSALIGLSGSVLGSDRLTAYASTGRGGTGLNQLSREVGVRYMYLFD